MAKIYNDFASANLMSFAKSFARLNGQPLDKSEIWYSLAEAQAYAATDAAYVGQILAVIDTDNEKVVFYGIQDAAGSLKEVGSTPIGDDLSVEIVDGAIQLKNFGKKYYAYVPAVKDEETGEIIEASKYVLTDGFKAGLEPRVIVDGENLVIAWYEPGSETVEDVAANVEAVNKVVDELDEVLNAEGGLVDQVDELKDQVGSAADEMGNEATGLYKEIENVADELNNLADIVDTKANAEVVDNLAELVDTKANASDVNDLADVVETKADAEDLNELAELVDTKANAADVYTKEAANEKIANEIAAAIAGADHLRRIIVDSVADIDVAAEDALNFIYMVPTGLQYDDDKYDEYIVIEYMGQDEDGQEAIIRQVERVGSWEVDLSNYAKIADLNALSGIVADNKAAAEQAIADNKALIDADIDALEEIIADNKDAAEQAIADNKALIDADIDAVEKAIEDEAKRAAAAEAANADEIAKKADKATTLEGYGITDAYTKEEANKKIEDALKNATGGESAADVKTALDNYKELNDARVDDIEEALEALEGAEPNYITAVEEEFAVTDGVLALNEIPMAKVANLQDSLQVIQSDVLSLEEILNGKTLESGEVIKGVVSSLSDLEATVADLSANFVNYVTVEDFNAVVQDIKNLQDQDVIILEDIDMIKEILQWKDIESSN